jgi:hypothetical protein
MQAVAMSVKAMKSGVVEVSHPTVQAKGFARCASGSLIRDRTVREK